jgi:hypothetical protein
MEQGAYFFILVALSAWLKRPEREDNLFPSSAECTSRLRLRGVRSAAKGIFIP